MEYEKHCDDAGNFEPMKYCENRFNISRSSELLPAEHPYKPNKSSRGRYERLKIVHNIKPIILNCLVKCNDKGIEINASSDLVI